MFGKGYFEGDFRTKPIVNNRGATRAENKEQLLERARLDRKNREVNNAINYFKIAWILSCMLTTEEENKSNQYFTGQAC